jgi:hypothetical protein
LQGVQGVQGDDGAAGVPGATGPQGATGATGAQGLQGVQGEVGAPGSQGPAGADGADGPAGADGAVGADGPAGADGAVGADGPAGADGAVGDTGADGPAGPGGLTDFGYVYNTGIQTVAVEGDVTFSANGVLTDGITHVAGTDAITLVDAGVYKITSSVSAVAVSQLALFVNGVEVIGTIYGSGAGTQQNVGQAIITIGASDVLTLRNHSTDGALTLQSFAGGSQPDNVNASIIIEKLG